jgi:hypothetical protein
MGDEPRSVGGVVRRGFAVWAQSAITLWGVLVPLALASQLVSVVAVIAAAPSGSFVQNGTIFVPAGAATSPIRIAHLVGIALTAIVGVLGAGAGLRIFAQTAAGSTPAGRPALRFAWSHFGSLVWLGILYAAVVLGGSFLLVLPGLYILIACTAAFPVLAGEEQRGLRALGRARELSKGRWWATLGAMLPSWILAGGGTALILFVVRVNGSVTNYALAQAFGGFVIQVLLVPLGTAASVAVYLDLRARREPMPTNNVGRAIIAPLTLPPPSGDIWWS